MAKQNLAFLAFNRGLISPLALARSDIKRLALSAEVFVNFVARALGAMVLRPGLGYIAPTKSNNTARCLPFVFSTSDVARVEFTDLVMRVFVDDTVITRPAVTSAVTNGNFTTDLSGWTDNDEGGASVWVTGGYMGLTGDGTNAAIRDQTVSVGANANIEHALRVVVNRGPVIIRVGTSTSDDSYVNETTLDTGEFSIAFTPTGDFNIRFMSRLKRQVLVDSCTIEAAGEMQITSPYPAASLSSIIGGPDQQSGDIIFLSCAGYQQRKIERRATRSWGLCTYYADDGPFRIQNTGPVTIAPGALSGNTTLTASKPLFRATHVGALFRVTSAGQQVTASISAQNTFTNAIEVTGVGDQRIFQQVGTGVTASGSTVTRQASITSSTGPWTDIESFIVDFSAPVDDGLDNQTVWYRLGVKTGAYAAGTQVVTLTYPAGSIDGTARVTGFTSSTVVNAEVLTDFGSLTATADWAEGQWSDLRGWPTANSFYEGRLWWVGKNGIDGSISDAFTSFLDTTVGDSGPISRVIGAGPVDVVNWVLPLQRLILGAEGAEFSARASSFDEILTPSNFNLKPASTQGSAGVQGVKIDSHGIFVQRGGTRVFELAFDSNEAYDYSSTDLSILIPEIGRPRITRMAVQRQPDTRVHFVRSDGTAAVLIYNKAENLTCWLEIETDGEIEDVSVLPGASGDEEDQVYYVVKRTVNGATVRYHEKWAMESECIGGTTNKQADSFVTFSQTSSTTIGGLGHLVGEDVVVWQDGICPEDADGDPKTFTVSPAGQIVVDTAAVTGMAGLPYRARFQSGKLSQIQEMLGSALTRHKKLASIGLILAYTHHRGIRMGQDFDNLRGMPTTERGKPVPDGTIWTAYDEPSFAVNGSWDTDARLCLEANAPRPATVLCAVVEAEAT